MTTSGPHSAESPTTRRPLPGDGSSVVPSFAPTPAPAGYVEPPRHWWSPGQSWRETRWGTLDLLVTIPVLLAAVGLTAVLGSFLAGDVATVVALIGGALVWVAVPVLAVRLRGTGSLRHDLGFEFRAADLGLGALGFIGASFVVYLFTLLALAATGQEQPVGNTGFVRDAADRPVVAVAVALLVGLIVPIGEELFFRGLVLRAVTKSRGIVVGSIVSWFVFTLGHFQGGTWEEILVLYTSIGALGIVLTALTLWTGRLGPSIVTHIILNSLATAFAIFGWG